MRPRVIVRIGSRAAPVIIIDSARTGVCYDVFPPVRRTRARTAFGNDAARRVHDLCTA